MGSAVGGRRLKNSSKGLLVKLPKVLGVRVKIRSVAYLRRYDPEVFGRQLCSIPFPWSMGVTGQKAGTRFRSAVSA